MKYKSLNINTSVLLSTILDLFILLLAIYIPGSTNIITLILTIVSIILFNLMYFVHININPNVDFIVKNIFNLLLYIYILFYTKKNIYLLLISVGIMCYKIYQRYSLSNYQKSMIFVGEESNFNVLSQIYNNNDIKLSYQTSIENITNQHIIYDNSSQYINSIMNDYNNNTFECIDNKTNNIHQTFINNVINRNKTGALNNDFWNNKSIYIICNDSIMINTIYNKIHTANNITFTVLTTNNDLCCQNTNIIIEYLDLNNMDQYISNIIKNTNILLLDLYYVPTLQSFNNSYCKILKFLIDISKQTNNINIFSCISHDLSLESYKINEARYICLQKNCFVYKAGMIVDYIPTYPLQNEIKTLYEYTCTSIDNISNMIAYELHMIMSLGSNITLVENNTISLSKFNKIYNNYHLNIQPLALKYQVIQKYKQYTNVNQIYPDHTAFRNIYTQVLKGDINSIFANISSVLDLYKVE